MSLKEYVAREVETLGDSELQAVADYVLFLKFRTRRSLDEVRLASLYGEFEQEDRELAESGVCDYVHGLAREDAQ